MAKVLFSHSSMYQSSKCQYIWLLGIRSASQQLHSLYCTMFKWIFSNLYSYECLSFVQQMAGFVRLLTAGDIPQQGENNYMPFPGNKPEPVSQRISATVSPVATFFKNLCNSGCKSAIQSNHRSFEFCSLIGPHG